MNEKILFVDRAPCASRGAPAPTVPAIAQRPEFDATTAYGVEDAMECFRASGPFAVVVCDHELVDGRGTELVACIHEEWPDCVAVLMTGDVEVDVVIEALHTGRIFRFLERPCPKGRLHQVLTEALAEHGRRHEAHRRTVELDFSKRVLSDFNGLLDTLVSERTTSLVLLHRFVSDLNACASLEEIMAATADAAGATCTGRGIFIELWDGGPEGARCKLVEGPALPGTRHAQSVEVAGRQVGSIVVASVDAAGRRLTKTQRAMLASIASSCGVAVLNQIRSRERDQAQQSTIVALAKLAERRDNETGKHLERVSRYCQLIAAGLRDDDELRGAVTEEWIRDLVRSAPLHDIGKVGIPDRILLKPGKLDADEWAIMKTHAEIGAETLRRVVALSGSQSFLAMSIEIAGCHHEKWDGTGYPHGLAGDDIPLAARILALADVYDALTSRRPYKEPWTHAASLDWIDGGSGSHFDPRVVAALFSRADEADSIRRELADSVEDLERIGLLVA